VKEHVRAGDAQVKLQRAQADLNDKNEMIKECRLLAGISTALAQTGNSLNDSVMFLQADDLYSALDSSNEAKGSQEKAMTIMRTHGYGSLGSLIKVCNGMTGDQS